MRPYHKYMQPFWVQKESEIESYFEDNDKSSFLNCPGIMFGMIVKQGYPATFQVQAFHYLNYERIAKKKISTMNSIVELGGGYGVMAKTIKAVSDCKYTIIDIPIINSVQQYFLRGDNDIDYVGLDILEQTTVAGDMFISLYALSETTEDMVNYVLKHKFFGAKNILMCFNKQDCEEFKFSGFVPELEKYGKLYDMNPETFYLIK